MVDKYKYRILIIDDDPPTCSVIQAIVFDDDCEIYTISDSGIVLGSILRLLPDLLIVDYVIPGIEFDLIVSEIEAARRHHNIRVIVVTGYPSVDSVLRCMRTRIDEYLTKPFQCDILREIYLNIRQGKLLPYKFDIIHQILPNQFSDTSQQITPMRLQDLIVDIIGSMCHDLNNRLTGVVGRLELAAKKNRRLPSIEWVRETSSAARGASEIGYMMHDFIKSCYSNSTPIEATVSGKQIGRWLRSHTSPGDASETIKCIITTVKIDAQLTFPIMLLHALTAPLITNALEAQAAQKRRGQLQISIKVQGLTNRKGLLITVADNGPGWSVLPETIQESLKSASPYTSKGKGRGRGLQIIHKIVHKLDGSLRLTNNTSCCGAAVELIVPWRY